MRVQALSHLTSTSFPVHLIWTCSNLIISTTDCPVLECMSLIISTSVSLSVTAQAVHQMTGQACLVMALYVQLSQPEDLFIFSLQNIIPIEFLFLHICKIILIQLSSLSVPRCLQRKCRNSISPPKNLYCINSVTAFSRSIEFIRQKATPRSSDGFPIG